MNEDEDENEFYEDRTEGEKITDKDIETDEEGSKILKKNSDIKGTDKAIDETYEDEKEGEGKKGNSDEYSFEDENKEDEDKENEDNVGDSKEDEKEGDDVYGNVNLSLRQLNHFKNENGKISFNFNGLTTQDLGIEFTIIIQIHLIEMNKEP